MNKIFIIFIFILSIIIYLYSQELKIMLFSYLYRGLINIPDKSDNLVCEIISSEIIRFSELNNYDELDYNNIFHLCKLLENNIDVEKSKDNFKFFIDNFKEKYL